MCVNIKYYMFLQFKCNNDTSFLPEHTYLFWSQTNLDPATSSNVGTQSQELASSYVPIERSVDSMDSGPLPCDTLLYQRAHIPKMRVCMKINKCKIRSQKPCLLKREDNGLLDDVPQHFDISATHPPQSQPSLASMNISHAPPCQASRATLASPLEPINSFLDPLVLRVLCVAVLEILLRHKHIQRQNPISPIESPPDSTCRTCPPHPPVTMKYWKYIIRKMDLISIC